MVYAPVGLAWESSAALAVSIAAYAHGWAAGLPGQALATSSSRRGEGQVEEHGPPFTLMVIRSGVPPALWPGAIPAGSPAVHGGPI
jgi:F0F1-type ATP synthase membrane subunit c/vacuolar-type H+-ATPase subunit K